MDYYKKEMSEFFEEEDLGDLVELH